MTHQQPSKEWEEDFQKLAAVNYNLYLGGTVFRADTQEEWTSVQAEQEIIDFIQSLLTSHSQSIRERVEGLRRKEHDMKVAVRFGSDAGAGHAIGYDNALDDILALLTDEV